MGADEAGTLAQLKARCKELIEPRIARHRGRTIKLMGGSALVEFPSVVAAVECAIEAQQVTAEHQAEVAEENRIAFRIGIEPRRTCGCLCHIGNLSAQMSGLSVGVPTWFPGAWWRNSSLPPTGTAVGENRESHIDDGACGAAAGGDPGG